MAVGGAAVLIAITFANQLLSRNSQSKAGQAGQAAGSIADQIRTEAEMVQAMGMRDAAFDRWQKARGEALESQIRATDVGGTFTSMTKTLRLFLQSAMLGLGAYLVLQGEMTAGAMIAGSILLGRALAPVEMALNQWPIVQRGREGWQNLATLLGAVAPEPPRTALPKPAAKLVAKNLTVVPPGERQASLKSINFNVEPGQAVGVIGPSGAGKTTLARTLTGVWPPAGATSGWTARRWSITGPRFWASISDIFPSACSFSTAPLLKTLHGFRRSRTMPKSSTRPRKRRRTR